MSPAIAMNRWSKVSSASQRTAEPRSSAGHRKNNLPKIDGCEVGLIDEGWRGKALRCVADGCMEVA